MLSKEEYIDIIENLDFFYGDNLIPTAELRKKKSKEIQEKDLENFKQKINCLKQLINEHFDNTSLKIDELKPNMVVWDNQLKEFIKIEEVLKDVNIITYHVFGESILCGGDFEEDIYYRFEVKDI